MTHSRTIALLLLFVLVWFAGLDHRALTRPDEGRYSEIPREMAVTGDWVTPRLNGLKYFEKPPLQYWATAAAFKSFGVREWTARLVRAVAGLAVAIVGMTVVRLDGQSGVYAALVLAGCFWHFALSQLLTLDSVSAAALCAFLLAQRDGLTRAACRNWMLVAYAAAGATLTQGEPRWSFEPQRWSCIRWRRATRVRESATRPPVGEVPDRAWFLSVSRHPNSPQFFFITRISSAS